MTRTVIVQTQRLPRVVIVNRGLQGPAGADGATGPQGPAGPSVWGGISGTLSTQTDLQNALDAKAKIVGGNALSGGSQTAEILSGATFFVGRNPASPASSATKLAIADHSINASAVLGRFDYNDGTDAAGVFWQKFDDHSASVYSSYLQNANGSASDYSDLQADGTTSRNIDGYDAINIGTGTSFILGGDGTAGLEAVTYQQMNTALGLKVDGNNAITGATKTKITYDSKGLVTNGADAAIADITGLQGALDLKANLLLANFTELQLSGNQVASYTYGSNANGKWFKLFDKTGAVLFVLQTWQGTISGLASTVTVNFPTAFPDVDFKVPATGNESGSGNRIGFSAGESFHTVSSFLLFIRITTTSATVNDTCKGIAYWSKA